MVDKHELFERFGRPVRLRDDIEGEVIVFAHNSQEEAQAFADANVENYGHPSFVQERKVWVSVTDLRPALEEIARGYTDGEI